MPKDRTILEVEDLTKIYGSSGAGIKNISFEVYHGEVVGFIGPNGAGKSTTMRTILGLTAKDKGKVKMFGNVINNERDLQAMWPKIGYLPAEGGLYENLTPKSLFSYTEGLYEKKIGSTLEKYIDMLKLDIYKPISKLSLGNKKKVGVIQAIMHNPKLLILDEPTAGLDPLIQQEVLKIIREIKESGGAVLLSSHVLSEVQAACDRIVMIKDGEIIFIGNTKEILKKALKVIKLEKPSQELIKKVEHTEGVQNRIDLVEEVVFSVKDVKPVINLLVKEDFYSFYIEKPTLEEKFLDLY